MPRPYRLAPLLLLCLAGPLAAQSAMPGMSEMGSATDAAQLRRVKAALERYRDPLAAVHDGYRSTLACVTFPTGEPGPMGMRAGAMGVHFLNANLIGPDLDTLRPQVLIYEPVRDTLRLVAAEWFMPVQVSSMPPRLFGQQFYGPMEGHEPIMPAAMHHWDLHVWLWKDNPSGIFSPTNPTVHGPPNGRYTVRLGPPRMVSAQQGMEQ